VDKTSINVSLDGYRRGVVFGLTMAEVMLLLIFCLLLFLKLIDDRKEIVENTLEDARQQNTQLLSQLEILEDYLATTDPAGEKSEFVELIEKSARIMEAGNSEKTEELKELLQDDIRAIEQLALVTEENWTVMVEEAQQNVPEEILEIVNDLNADQVSNLLANAELAANTPPRELKEKVTRSSSDFGPEQIYRYKLSERVELKDLEDLASGKLEKQGEGNNWPPIISLSEAEDYSFTRGRADLTENFKSLLKTKISNTILTTLLKYDADVIEVIGHTDLDRMRQTRTTNLDDRAFKFFEEGGTINLRAKDNAGLGYARALSVVTELSRIPSLQGYTILPYSGAQMISPDETINIDPNAFEADQLRRIEIRVRRKSVNNLDQNQE
jgi:flagellar motor protein MotB